MAKSKKTHAILHPVDTVVNWYDEAAQLPEAWKKSAVHEMEKAAQQFKHLKTELNHAKKLLKEANAHRVAAAKKLKSKVGGATGKLVKHSNTAYDHAVEQVKKITKDMEHAKKQIQHFKARQKYIATLEKAFKKATKVFTKKAAKPKKRKSAKRRKTAAKKSVVAHTAAPRKKRRKVTKVLHKKTPKTKRKTSAKRHKTAKKSAMPRKAASRKKSHKAA